MKFLVLKRVWVKLFAFVLLCGVLLSINFDGNGVMASVYMGQVPRKVPIYAVDTTEKKVAISFDSAWGADKTLSILETLKEYNAGATFFLVGFWVDKHPDMVKKIDEFGIEIGTHSNTHPDMAKLSASQVRQELSHSMKLITDIINKPVKLFRAPFGSYNNTLLDEATALGLKTIQWDVDTLDWKGLSAVQIASRVMSLVKNGSIILCHNNADHIVEALPLILDRLKLAGYTVTSIGDLIYQDNYYTDHAGLQKLKAT